MAAVINLADVKTSSIANGFTDDILTGFIDFIDQADTCLDDNSIPESIQKAIKLNGVWSLCYLNRSGNISSEKSANGGSITYGDNVSITGNPYGQALQAMDVSWCVLSLFGQTGNSFIFGAVSSS